jgi:hypothetical protein
MFVSISINLFCLPAFGFLNKSLKIYKLIKSSYFNSLSEKSIDIVYVALFVKYLKKVVTANRNKININSETILSEINKTKESEISHLLPYPFLIASSILFLIYFKPKLSVLILLFSIPVHFMPIILQRKNRNRLEKVLNKFKK